MTLAASRELTETGPQCKVNVSTATGANEQNNIKILRLLDIGGNMKKHKYLYVLYFFKKNFPYKI